MKATLRAHFLLYLARIDERSRGFTIIEILVVLMIIGFLSAIALPSMLAQSNKARESEAKTYVGAINRGQQAYFLQTSEFGYLADLQLGISSSANYTYDSVPSGNGMTAVADTTAQPVGTVRGYAGRVWLTVLSDGNATSISMVCSGDAGVAPVVTGTDCPP